MQEADLAFLSLASRNSAQKRHISDGLRAPLWRALPRDWRCQAEPEKGLLVSTAAPASSQVGRKPDLSVALLESKPRALCEMQADLRQRPGAPLGLGARRLRFHHRRGAIHSSKRRIAPTGRRAA